MGKFIITYNAGHRESAEVVEADTLNEALNMAYEAWRDEAESNADYNAVEYSDNIAEDHGLEE